MKYIAGLFAAAFMIMSVLIFMGILHPDLQTTSGLAALALAQTSALYFRSKAEKKQ